MATFRDLANDALLDLGVLAAGEVGSNDDLTNALRAMNRLIDQWAAERLTIYTVTATQCTLVDGTQTYTVGAGGDFNVPRPTYIDHVTFKYTPAGGTFPIELPLSKFTDDEWAAQTIKTLTSTLPRGVYYNPTYPLGTIKFWPIPTSPPATLYATLYAPEQVGEFTDLNTVVSLPPGYRRFIVKNLAVELAPSYQRNVAPEIMMAASESKQAVKVSNVHMRELVLDTSAFGKAAVKPYYIRTGE